MLIELKKLNVSNEGYRRKVFLDKIYVNTTHIVSISDYAGANDFLLSEGDTRFAEKSFSLIKISNFDKIEEMVVLGSSEEIYHSFNEKRDKKLLNG